MSMNPDETDNRMAKGKNRVGRPPAAAPAPVEAEAQILSGSRLPPIICPVCGRGMQPTVSRVREDGKIDGKCSLNACRFLYTPPKIRPLA